MKIIISIAIFFVCFGVIHLATVYGADSVKYTPMVVIPGLDANEQSTEAYVNALYILSITVAAFLAVVKIIFGGVQWMLSDVITTKQKAKDDIKGAIFGLLIVLTAVLVLQTINPELIKLDFLRNAAPITTTLQNHSTPNVTCPSGSTFVKETPFTPGGSCKTTTSSDVDATLLEDETVTPSQLQSNCSVQYPGSTYNPQTQQCETSSTVIFVPQEDLASGRGAEFCFGYQRQFNPTTNTCD